MSFSLSIPKLPPMLQTMSSHIAVKLDSVTTCCRCCGRTMPPPLLYISLLSSSVVSFPADALEQSTLTPLHLGSCFVYWSECSHNQPVYLHSRLISWVLCVIAFCKPTLQTPGVYDSHGTPWPHSCVDTVQSGFR